MSAIAHSIPTNIYTLVIDGRGRPKTSASSSSSSSASHYIVAFDDVYKSVMSVELVFALYDTSNSTHKYVNLFIDELDSSLKSNYRYADGAYCQLPTTAVVGATNSYFTNMFRTYKTFNKPLAKLGRMTIRFVDPDGTPSNISEDHLLRFEITCMQLTGEVSNWKHMDIITDKTATQYQYKEDTHYKVLGIDPSNLPESWTDIQRIFKERYKELKANNASPQELRVLKNAFKKIAVIDYNETM
jgi:hypothetical protein